MKYIKPCEPSVCKVFLFAKKYLKKFDLGVDSVHFKVYNKDIELGTT